MWWFKRHPELLRIESGKLSSNGNYKEILQCRDNFFVSCGEIIVRLDVTQKYPILIVYPHSTPYSLPIVFLLKRLFNENEIKEISSKGDREKLFDYIKENIEFYNRRHQGADGSLCLLEADNLYNEGAESYSAHDIINRVRDWFAGLTTGNFPPDSPEVELFAHFKNQNREIELLFPESFYDKSVVQGEFYSARIASIPPQINQFEKKIYLGALLHGQNISGIYTKLEFQNALHLLPEEIETPLDLLTKKQILKSAIESKELLKVYWWHIDREPTPFDDFSEFSSYLGNGDIEKGYGRFYNILQEEVKSLTEKILIALRFPNRREGLEWQVFRLIKTKFDAIPLIGKFYVNNFKEVIGNYKIEAIHSEPLVDVNYHKRNSARARRDILKEERINVIGCGALGGEIADCLAKAGIGHFNLIDKEEFSAHNPIRHIVGMNRIGTPKALALAEILMMHNPFIRVLTTPIDILKYNVNNYFFDNSISISSIADDNIEGYLNEQAIIYNKIIFYARALRGGKVARIFRVIPGVDACMHCLSLYYQEKDVRFTHVPEDKELATITNECNNPIRPASGTDLKMISSITSRLVIDFLQNGDNSKNHWIWTMEKIEGLEFNEVTPFVLHASFLPPHPHCMFCSKEDPIKVHVEPETYTFMKKETNRELHKETGGVLVGYKMDNGDIYVRFASGAGSMAKRTEVVFEKDIKFCQTFIDKKYQEYGENGVYVGEWHYHPKGSNHPSNVDLLSLSQIAVQKEYLTQKPIMIIFSGEGKASCTVHPADKKYYLAEIVIESDKK